MAKFVYRMQSVLDIKYKIEAQTKAHYAMMQMRFNEEQEKLEKMIIHKKYLEDKYRKTASGSLR